jgi:L-asparaginase II
MSAAYDGARYAGGTPLVEVVRSGFVEGRHCGSVAIVNAAGELVASAGDPRGPIFPRSSNKPIQAVAMLRSGLDLAEPADLAVVAASHWAEPMHVDRIRALLRSGGLSEDDLRCPPDLPLSEAQRAAVLRAGQPPQRILMNCSGKHAGMLLTCVAAGWPLEDYRCPEHPLQKACRAVLEELCGEGVAAVGVDGCGAAVMAVSLAGLARAFLRIVSADAGTPQRRVADAMRAYPELMSGSDAQDARLMRAVPGMLVKGGAEGVTAAAVPGLGAVAVKIDDGAARATLPAVVLALRALGGGSGLDAMAEPVVLGGGVPVGSLRAIGGLDHASES